MQKLSLVALCLTLVMFGYLINYYNINFPIADDYDAYLRFLNNFVLADSFKLKFLAIMQQHVDHRIVIGRLVALAYYKVFANINFRNLLFISQLIMVLGIYPFTWLLNKANGKYKQYNLILATCFMLTPSLCSSFVWLTVTLQQYIQILFSLLSIMFLIRLEKNKSVTNYLVYFLCMLCNVFSGGGWIILCGAVLLYYLLRKQKLQFSINLLFFIIMAIIFFKVIPYTLLPHPFSSIFRLLLFILGFTGSTFFTGIPYIAQFTGFVIIVYVLFNLKTIKDNNIYLIWFLFFFTTAFVVGIGRAEFSLGTDDRYAIYSLLNLAFIINMLSQRHNFIKGAKFWLTLIIIFIIAFIRELPDNGPYHNYQEGRFTLNYPHVPIAEELYNKSKLLGIYSSNVIDSNIAHFLPINNSPMILNGIKAKAHLHALQEDDKYVRIIGSLKVNSFDIDKLDKYIVWKSPNAEYWFTMNLYGSPPASLLYKLIGNYYTKFESVSDIENMKPGNYTISIYLTDGQKGGFATIKTNVPINGQ